MGESKTRIHKFKKVAPLRYKWDFQGSLKLFFLKGLHVHSVQTASAFIYLVLTGYIGNKHIKGN